MTTFPPKSPCPTCGSDLTLSAAPPVQMEAVAWRPIETAPTDGTQVDLWCRRSHGISAGGYGRVPDCWHSAGKWWRNDDNGDDMLRSEVHNATHWMPRPNSPFATNASPVPSSERDEPSREIMLNGRQVTISGLALEILDTMEKSAAADARAAFERGYGGAKRADADRIAMIIQDDLRIERGHLENVAFVAVKIAESIERPSSERDNIIEMCAQWHDARAICLRAVAAKWGDHRSTKRVALEALAVADVHEDSASSIRSLKSQPAQEAE